jgi:chemotaxis protein methyltransferase CheR
MSPSDFEFLSALIKLRSGLALSTDKMYLLNNRLGPIAHRRGLDGVPGLVGALRTRRDEALVREVVEAMTTNESLFFRDGKPFELLRDAVLPRILARRSRDQAVRIWSAACSSGQEAYSIAMTLREQGGALVGRRFEIVGTDIATAMLAKARAGVYTQFEVQRGLPIRLLVKYFKQTGSDWEIDAGLRASVRFLEHNILEDFRPLGLFDIVFCRNILIYFDQAAKRDVLERIHQVMPADGVLFLGAAETVIGLSDLFRPLENFRSAYQRNEGASRRAAG